MKTKKTKDLPVTKTELESSMQYIDTALKGRFRSMETKILTELDQFVKDLVLLTNLIKGLSVLFIISFFAIIIFFGFK